GDSNTSSARCAQRWIGTNGSSLGCTNAAPNRVATGSSTRRVHSSSGSATGRSSARNRGQIAPPTLPTTITVRTGRPSGSAGTSSAGAGSNPPLAIIPLGAIAAATASYRTGSHHTPPTVLAHWWPC